VIQSRNLARHIDLNNAKLAVSRPEVVSWDEVDVR
jgi:hypothetical protein